MMAATRQRTPDLLTLDGTLVRLRASDADALLGLYIVREIAVAHGGGVGVVSEAEIGMTFTVTLPRAAGKAGTAAEAPRSLA